MDDEDTESGTSPVEAFVLALVVSLVGICASDICLRSIADRYVEGFAS